MAGRWLEDTYVLGTELAVLREFAAANADLGADVVFPVGGNAVVLRELLFGVLEHVEGVPDVDEVGERG